MKFQNFFNRQTAVIMLLTLGALLAISPAGLRKASVSSPAEIAAAITSESDHITAEDLAARIIDKDPDLLIVDLRPAEEYQRYHIPGAINIPLSRLFEPEFLEQLDEDRTTVLYSNGGAHSAQAWTLLKQTGIDAYTLLGGLNYWAEAILNPGKPGDLAEDSEVLQYQFQKSASAYFNQSRVDIQQKPAGQSPQPPKTNTLPPRKKKKKAGEGC